MKIQLLSDLHLECFKKNLEYPQISKTDADTVVLAGDIGEGLTGVEYAIEQSIQLNKDIIYVPGNHEYYGQNMAVFKKQLFNSTKGTQVHLLDNSSIVINGIRFIGATLWTNFGNGNKELMKSAFMRINDYRTIRATQWWGKRNRYELGVRRIRHSDISVGYFLPETAFDEHKQSIEYLKQELDKSFNGKIVVVTHHAPSWKSIEELVTSKLAFEEKRWVSRLKDDFGIVYVAGYASNLNSFIAKYSKNINLWLHGHTHVKLDYELCGIRIVSNPSGRPYNVIPHPAEMCLGVSLHDYIPKLNTFGGDVSDFDDTKLIELN